MAGRPQDCQGSLSFSVQSQFAHPLPRVLPVIVDDDDKAKVERSRATFWEQIDLAADETNDAALRAVQTFGRKIKEDESLVVAIRSAVADKDLAGRVTFEFHRDGGKTVLERPEVRNWYVQFFQRFTTARQQAGQSGFCTLAGRVSPLPRSHDIKLSGIPGGLATGVSIVSFDKAAFRHYDLDGAENAAIGYEGADGYARGFQWLRANKDHYFVIG